jgi:hypothetical protein
MGGRYLKLIHNDENVIKDVLNKQLQITVPSCIVKSLQYLCVRAVDKQLIKNKTFIKSSRYAKMLTHDNSVLGMLNDLLFDKQDNLLRYNVQNMLMGFEWTRQTFTNNSFSIFGLPYDFMQPLPRYIPWTPEKMISCCTPKHERTIQTYPGYAIANVRVIGTGWIKATIRTGHDNIAVAFENVSNEFDMLEGTSYCLPMIRVPFTIDSPADVEYNIVQPVYENDETTWAFAVKLIHRASITKHTKLDSDPSRQVVVINPIITACSMIRLVMSKTTEECPCLLVERQKSIVQFIRHCDTQRLENTPIYIPFVKHCNSWKLEFDPPVILKPGTMISYPDGDFMPDDFIVTYNSAELHVGSDRMVFIYAAEVQT